MGAWGYSITECDSSLDFVDEVVDIIGEYHLIYSVINNDIFNEKIHKEFILKQDEIKSFLTDISIDILTYGLFLINLKIKPSEDDVILIEKALEEEFLYIVSYDSPEERKTVLEDFKAKFIQLKRETK